jgi:hypothetical protein
VNGRGVQYARGNINGRVQNGSMLAEKRSLARLPALLELLPPDRCGYAEVHETAGEQL